MKLYGFWRSSASWRLRIALNLKGVTVENCAIALGAGEQFTPEFLTLNPQGLVPALVLDDGTVITQTLAIIEWLEERYPYPPLLPADAIIRAKVRAVAYVIACDTHPLQNLRVLKAVKALSSTDAEDNAWARRINAEGLAACEAMLTSTPGPFAFGAAPTLADICIVPQMGNALRFGVDLNAFPRLLALEAACNALPAFAAALPANQPDAL